MKQKINLLFELLEEARLVQDGPSAKWFGQALDAISAHKQKGEAAFLDDFGDRLDAEPGDIYVENCEIERCCFCEVSRSFYIACFRNYDVPEFLDHFRNHHSD